MGSFDDPLTRLEHQARDALARYGKLRADTEGLTAIAASPDGAVRVVATAVGELQKLKLGPEVKRYSLEQLADTILTVTRNAQATAAEAYAERSQEFVDSTAGPRRLDRETLRNLMRRIDR